MSERPGVDTDADPLGAGRALVVVSAGVLLASSTWFSGTAVAPALLAAWGLDAGESAWLTSAVQLGFITGTFGYAVLNVADHFNPRRVFFVSALLGAGCNAAFALLSQGLVVACLWRFLTGVTLAGVYPVGMKIVASWFRSGLGWRLGVMVGALTAGTASPYLLRAVGADLPWRALALAASGSAVAGGVLLLVGVGDGPHLKARAAFDPRMLVRVFGHRPFRENAFGYFGHMWELYALWSLVGFYVSAARDGEKLSASWVPAVAFATVAAGAVGCVAGGWVSRSVGERRVALVSLAISATACLLSGLLFTLPPPLLVLSLLVWGVFVVSDSPQFSALAARTCPPAYTATALTVQTGVGFAISVVSIQWLPWVAEQVGWQWTFLVLAPGPLLGAWRMTKVELVGKT